MGGGDWKEGVVGGNSEVGDTLFEVAEVIDTRLSLLDLSFRGGDKNGGWHTCRIASLCIS